MDIERMYKFIVMEHINTPLNKDESLDETNSLRVINASCGDNLFITIEFDGDIIRTCNWNGTGCSLSMSVSSIMSNWIKDNTIDEVSYKLENYENLVLNKDYDEQIDFDELLVMKNQLPARYKCATLFKQGVEAIFASRKDNNGN